MRGDAGGGGGVGGLPGHRRPRPRLRRLHLPLRRDLGGRTGRHRRCADRRHHHPHRHPGDAGRRPAHRHHTRAAPTPDAATAALAVRAEITAEHAQPAAGTDLPSGRDHQHRRRTPHPARRRRRQPAVLHAVVSVRRGCRAISPTVAWRRLSSGCRSATHLPAGPGLVDHLARLGYSDAQIEAAGMGSRARTGRLVDRFRDRLILPVHDHAGELVGFVGRLGTRHGRRPVQPPLPQLTRHPAVQQERPGVRARPARGADPGRVAARAVRRTAGRDRGRHRRRPHRYGHGRGRGLRNRVHRAARVAAHRRWSATGRSVSPSTTTPPAGTPPKQMWRRLTDPAARAGHRRRAARRRRPRRPDRHRTRTHPGRPGP